MNFVGYVRVSTEEQTASGAGLEAQREAIALYIRNHNLVSPGDEWTLEDIIVETASGGSPWAERPELSKVLVMLEAGKVDALIVSKLDRLTRGIRDFQNIVDESARGNWELVVVDMQVDTTTATGRLLANIMVAFSQFEREIIGERTRDALRAKRAAGVILGRVPRMPEHIVARIVELSGQGKGTRAIASQLTREGVPTVEGGRWWASTIEKTLRRTRGDVA